MEHVTDIEMLEHIAGRLAGEDAGRVDEHISSCEHCTNRREDMRQTWEGLGEWQVDAAGRDAVAAVVSRCREEAKRPASAITYKRLAAVGFRIAASIIIAIGIGGMSGAHMARRELSLRSALSEAPEYTAALGLQWSSDLNWAFLEEHADDGEGE